TEHLAAIRTPMLFLSGTRDRMARVDLLDNEVGKLGSLARVHWIEGADHGFHVLKRSGRTDDDVRTEATSVLAEWLKTRVGAS
ncbi:MAG: dienelactone hydrolase family protein, partial [SAR324 cluster bacterium]|nr:dienelactone hydrolase family protein [SAR324 cluster bacterium]